MSNDMTEENEVMATPAQQERAARVIDALEEIQQTVSAFQKYLHQPLALVCEHFWNSAVSELSADTAVVVVPQAELFSYNPEPENPDSGAQLLHMPGGYERTEENIALFGIPMSRVITPKYETDIELTAVKPSNTTVKLIDSVLYGAVQQLVRELAAATKSRPGQQLIVTPLQGAVVLNAENPERMGVYMYVLCGWRDAANWQVPEPA